ncbi:MAG TPA: uroporphyrinogen III synthase, partial [Chloroflexi bacterium]|nr:uroporphyrinogen III synthase [Chloroflexota bacterium]
MRRTLITRPLPDAHELARLMRAAGLEPICFPTIEIRPIPIEENPALQHALKNL